MNTNPKPEFQILRSSVPGKIPSLSQLEYGELALNFFDGKLFFKQSQGNSGVGTRVVPIGVGNILGKTIFVTSTGNDANTGLSEVDAKATIKSAASLALPGDTIKVYPGIYVEDNPIVLNKTVSVEGTELRNCIITPKNTNRDLFHVNNGCHVTDVSFVGPKMTDGSAVVALQPLLGFSDNRYFDAARLIRLNLDYIAKESVGFLTSGFSGFAGNHREQDAARLIDKNLDYIAAETVGFLTSPIGYNFSLVEDDYTNCKEDVVSIFNAISYDLKANSNKKSVGAALSYFNSSGGLIHITGISTQQATIASLNYAIGIAKSVIDNVSPPVSYQSGISSVAQVIDPSVIIVPGGCVAVGTTISQLVGIITSAIGAGDTSGLPAIRYGVTLESEKCSEDINSIWRSISFDITRGGNSKSVNSGKAYYDENGDLLPGILKNPQEVAQTIATVDYSFNIARSVINNATWGGYPATDKIDVLNAEYDNITGITTITTTGPHGLSKNDPTRIVGLSFTCAYNPLIPLEFPREGDVGVIFPVESVVGPNTFTFVGAASTLAHYYASGGTIQKYKNFQDIFTQVKDLSIQKDPETGFNNSVNSCQNVVSALKSCVGIVTSIIYNGPSILGFGTDKIKVTYPGNSGIGFTSVLNITNAVYDNVTGRTTLTVPNLNIRKDDLIEIRDLIFECSSGIVTTTQRFPSGKYGYEFYVERINPNGSFDINVGISTLKHTYVEGGIVVDRSIKVTSASYDNVTGITTIVAPGAFVRVGDYVNIRNLEFECNSGSGTTTIYPTGNNGYEFKVLNVESIGNSFTVNVGPSTITHTYLSGGLVFPPYSRGVGPVTQGPYVRNSTNFIPGSIGMKIDGFDAEPGDLNDIGVTGTMSVDSYTQYNQGGIGVSITNGAYAQLVSIFTICNDIAVFTGSGGQCDITNSNSSFGRLGLVGDGVGDEKTKSIYRMTGIAVTTTPASASVVTLSGVGTFRPYDGQVCYFGDLYYFVNEIEVTDPGFGYITPPKVYFSLPDGENGIRPQATTTIQNGRVISVNILNSGTQYLNPPTITIDPPPGIGVTATAQVTSMEPIYYKIDSATLPSVGITTISLLQKLNNTVGAGTTIYFSRVSLQITSSHSFEWVGSGNDINKAKPSLGGVVIPENEVVQTNGGIVVYTSTDQSGNFKVGDGVIINQATGQISGRSFNQSLFATITPFILAITD